MVMITYARHVVMHQQTKHGAQTKRSVQHKTVINHTMLVQYASVAIINY
jgi:hypothetical protein